MGMKGSEAALQLYCTIVACEEIGLQSLNLDILLNLFLPHTPPPPSPFPAFLPLLLARWII